MKNILAAVTIFTAIVPFQNAFAANIAVKCFTGPSTGTPLVSFEVAKTASLRLVSDLNEVRSTTDSETLPAFLVSQYRFSKSQIIVEMDDASANGNIIAKLLASGERVPTGQVDSDNPIYGIWSGTYERFDAGRTLYTRATCYAK